MRWTSRHPIDVCSALLSRAYRDTCTIHSQLSTLTFYPQIQRFLPRIHQQCDEGFLGQRPVPKIKYNVILINETNRCQHPFRGAFNFAQGSGTVVFLTAVIWNFSVLLSPQNNGWKDLWMIQIYNVEVLKHQRAFPQSFLEIIFILCTVLCTVRILSTLPCVLSLNMNSEAQRVDIMEVNE